MTGRFAKSETVKLRAVTSTHLLIEGQKVVSKVPFRFVDKLTVCQPVELALVQGDQNAIESQCAIV